jgi:acetoin utilization deacetylase AcuC-like enzyme
MGSDHPERPERLSAIQDRLLAGGLLDFMLRMDAPAAPVDALERVHDPAHVRRILEADCSQGEIQIDADTLMNVHSHEAALHAAGAGLLAVDLVMSDKASLAFCAVRPPGHHAERARAMGFCFFNNIAVAAAHALARGLSRVAILDFDLHYGNGTADIFGNDPRVLVCSTYQHPLYPYWETDANMPSLVDVPLPPMTGGSVFRSAVCDQWLPKLEQFKPELILVSAGFDAHFADPMGDLRFGIEDYRWIGGVIQGIADACCDGRVVATLEGGYDLNALARSVEAFLQPFIGEMPA